MKTITLPIDDICTGGGTQTRSEINHFVVNEYAELMQAGVKFPPVEVVFDGENYWLVDGFHRHHAAAQAEVETLEAIVRDGTHRDAILAAAKANATHGLRRTNADKKRAALVLLNDSEWKQWSDNAIAEACCVSQPFVSKIRAELITVISSEPQRRLCRNGKKQKVESKRKAKPKPAYDAATISAAAKLNVTPEAVVKASEVIKGCIPEVVDAAKHGRIELDVAHDLIGKPAEEQLAKLPPVEEPIVNDAGAVELVNTVSTTTPTETIVEADEVQADEDHHDVDEQADAIEEATVEDTVDAALGDEIASRVMRVRRAVKDAMAGVLPEHLAAVLAAVRAELDRIEERIGTEVRG